MMKKKYAICLGFGDQYLGSGMSRLPFAYKNVLDLSERLKDVGYTVFQVIPESIATKQIIVDHFIEKINMMQKDDWLLFYYVGHGNIHFNAASANKISTYLVTSFSGYDSNIGYLNFFTDDDYASIIKIFNQKVPFGHLISILDCCYAFGMVDAFKNQDQYHTIIAASSFDKKAYYGTNSFFFQAFKSLWTKRLLTLTKELPRKMREMNDASRCQCQIASNFINQNL